MSHAVLEPERHPDMEAVFNFRDLGGYDTIDGRRTRWHRVYRADGLHRMTPADVAEVRRRGLRTVIDLRTVAELEKWGRFPVESHDVDFHHLPILDVIWDPSELPPVGDDEVGFVVDRYRDMIRTGESRLAQAIRVIADTANQPVVFHCAAGKDRTGIVAALVLSLLGVPDETIVADYALSTGAMVSMRAWIAATHPELIEQHRDHPAAMLSAWPATMHTFLDVLRAEHGSIEAYVARIGVEPGAVKALRASLLD